MDFNLQTLYVICATVGGGLLVIQLILMLIGMDDGADADLTDFELDEAGIGGNLFFGHLSMKTVARFAFASGCMSEANCFSFAF